MTRARLAALTITLALTLALAPPLVARSLSPLPPLRPSPGSSPLPPPGERDPLVGFAAAAAIVVAGGAGLWVYRVIRKGL